MKVLLVNGSPKPKGNTYDSLTEIANTLEKQGIETEIFQLGSKPISGCIACSKCRETKRCIIDDKVNEFLEKVDTMDGFIFGSPVHFAGLSGALTSFLDRVFYSNMTGFRGKPAAGIVVCRRGGASASFDQLNKYFTICQMPIVSSNYWNTVHAHAPGETKEDVEGLQTMRVIGDNMSWLLKCIEAGKIAGINMPEQEKRAWTNFIR